MKGIIALALKDMVTRQHGSAVWREILDKAGVPARTTILATSDIPDEVVLGVIKTTCERLGISLQEAADAFGHHWVNEFANRIYPLYFRRADNAREMLLNMDKVHDVTTRTMANAHPPRFDYEEPDSGTLIMTYKSERGLMPILVGLIRGVGTYYGEELELEVLNDERVRIRFPQRRTAEAEAPRARG